MKYCSNCGHDLSGYDNFLGSPLEHFDALTGMPEYAYVVENHIGPNNFDHQYNCISCSQHTFLNAEVRPLRGELALAINHAVGTCSPDISEVERAIKKAFPEATEITCSSEGLASFIDGASARWKYIIVNNCD